VGDADRDGLDDMLVGAPGAGMGALGVAYLVLGSERPAGGNLGDAARFYSLVPTDLAGSACAGAGDMDGDGYADFLIGAPSDDLAGTDAGAVYVGYGRDTFAADINLATLTTVRGSAAGHELGAAVASAGDTDGDGLDDALLGAPGMGAELGRDGTGGVVIYGESVVTQVPGEVIGDRAGVAVAGPGDVNGDGYADLLVGAPGRGDSAAVDEGAVYLVLGTGGVWPTGLWDTVEYTGAGADARAGSDVAAAGDVDGDGHADLLVGAPYADGAGEDAGAAYLIFGSTAPASASLADAITYDGAAAYDLAGTAVSGAGDVDGNGVPDLVIGAIGAEGLGADVAGAAYLVLGHGL
jgi:hypothetical protein